MEIKLSEVSELDDKVGDSHKLVECIDYNNRDKCFIDVDGRITLSKEGQWHSEILDDCDDVPFGSGCVYKDCAFIDIYERMTQEDVLSDLLKAHKFKKIYYYDFISGKIWRCW